MMHDTIATAISKIENYEKSGKKECLITPVSKITKEILKILNKHQYIGDVEEVKTSRPPVIKVNLLGNINRMKVIKPRIATKAKDLEKYEKRYLPAKDFGIIIISTQEGYITHQEAKQKNIGGKLIAYCY